MKELAEIIEGLEMIQKDVDIPKNVRARVKDTIEILSNDGKLEIKIDKSLEALGEVADDPAVPQHTKMQIWSLLSLLENRNI